MKLEKFKENLGLSDISPELEKLIAFQNNIAGFEEYSNGFGVLIDNKLGLKSWSDNSDFLDKLYPFAQANGSGSFYAFWNNGIENSINKMPIIVFGDEGGVHVIAKNILEFFQLLTFDSEISVYHDEAYFYKDEEDYKESNRKKEFLEWLKADYNIDEITYAKAGELINNAQEKYKDSFDEWFKTVLRRLKLLPIKTVCNIMNFEILSQEIEVAAKKAFLEMYEQHGADQIYAFALYSDEDAITVCPSTNTLKHLATADHEELNYYKFEPAEWKYEMKGADKEFSAISKQLYHQIVGSGIEEEHFLKFQKQLFDTCIGVLEKLKNEEFFKQIIGKDIFLTFTVSDYDFETKDIKDVIDRLNDNEYKTEYFDWMKAWEE